MLLKLSTANLAFQGSESFLVLLLIHLDFFVGVLLLVLLVQQLAHILIVDVDLVVVVVVVVIFVLIHVALHHVVLVLTDLFFTLHGLTIVVDDPVHLLTVSLVFLFHLTTFAILILTTIVHNLSLVVFIFLLLDEHFVLVKGNSLIALQAFFIILILDFTFALVTHFSLFIDLVHLVAVLVKHTGMLAFGSLIVRLLVKVILSVNGIALHEHDLLLFGEVLIRVTTTLDNLLAEVLELLVLVHEQVDLIELRLTLSVQSLNE